MIFISWTWNHCYIRQTVSITQSFSSFEYTCTYTVLHGKFCKTVRKVVGYLG
jgi:hypothetical protein